MTLLAIVLRAQQACMFWNLQFPGAISTNSFDVAQNTWSTVTQGNLKEIQKREGLFWTSTLPVLYFLPQWRKINPSFWRRPRECSGKKLQVCITGMSGHHGGDTEIHWQLFAALPEDNCSSQTSHLKGYPREMDLESYKDSTSEVTMKKQLSRSPCCPWTAVVLWR